MSVFGWCMTGKECAKCPGEYAQFFIDGKNKIQYTGQKTVCEHKCHKESK